MSSSVSLMTLFLFLFLFSSAFSLPEKPKPAAIQPVSSTVSSIPAITIPAFPEQTDSSSTCHLNLAEDLFNGVSKACTPSSLSFSHCCPTLAAWLYSAYSSTAIAAAVKLQSSEITPLLPDDSDTCMDSAQRALRRRGVVLGAINGSCDVARCFCGVRLRRFSCPEGFKIESSGDGRWVAGDERARRIEKDCASATSTNGCNRCLRSLRQGIISQQTKEKEEVQGGDSEVLRVRGGKKAERSRDCELMALTWLLARNRTKYMPSVIHVLGVLMMTPAEKEPLSCSISRYEMPMAANYVELDESTSSSSGGAAVKSPPVTSPTGLLPLWSLASLLLLLRR